MIKNRISSVRLPPAISAAFVFIVFFIRMLLIQSFSLQAVISLFVVSLLIFILSLLISYTFSKRNVSVLFVIIGAMVLTGIDVLSKHVVQLILKDNSAFFLIPECVAIADIKNNYQAIYFQIADVRVSGLIAGFIKLLSFPVLFFLFKIAKINLSNKDMRISLIFILSTMFCTALDSFIHGYTIDFILIKPFFAACDLKDIYAMIGLGFIACEIVRQMKRQFQSRSAKGKD